MSRPRLAYWSPLPPLASGIADYSAELLPHLAEHFDLEVFTEEGYSPDEALRRRFPVHGARAFPARRARFDAVLYQMGNNGGFHAGAYRTLLEVPGIVVLHEIVLHHMTRELTLVAGDPAAYLEEVRYCCGASGGALARRSFDTGTTLDAWSYPLFERVVDASLGVLVHSDWSRRRVLASRPEALVQAVPFPWSPGPPPASGRKELADGKQLPIAGFPPPEDEPMAELRARLGLPQDALILAAFGFMTRAKRLDVALRAFVRLAPEVPEAAFLIVGEVSSRDYDLAELVPEALRPRVIATGRAAGLGRFLDHMAACDVAINLRYPTAGETSASLYRLFGLGKPVVVSDAGSFAEVPAGCCARVPVDAGEEDLLLAYLRALARDPALRHAMGDAARRLVHSRHRVEQTAAAYAAAIHEILAAGRHPEPAVPPLAPYPPDDVLSDVVAGATAALVDLGAGEKDAELLRELALAIADLDLEAGLASSLRRPAPPGPAGARP